MDPTVIVLIVVIVLLVAALAAAAVMLMRRRRSDQLREQFGPEYERSVAAKGDRRSAESELDERRKRHSSLDIRELEPEERERFTTSWNAIQRGFVDDPVRSVDEADRLVVEIMRTRGYPVDDFDRRAEDISVEHPTVVHHYREARAVHDATQNGTQNGTVDTEQQRHAVTSYRALIEALLERRRETDRDRDGDRDRNGATERQAQDRAEPADRSDDGAVPTPSTSGTPTSEERSR